MISFLFALSSHAFEKEIILRKVFRNTKARTCKIKAVLIKFGKHSLQSSQGQVAQTHICGPFRMFTKKGIRIFGFLGDNGRVGKGEEKMYMIEVYMSQSLLFKGNINGGGLGIIKELLPTASLFK